MKKILFLAAALIMSIGAWAQGTSTNEGCVSELPTTASKQSYVLCTPRGTLLGTDNQYLQSTDLPANNTAHAFDKTKAEFQFLLLPVEGQEHGYYVYNVGTGKFLGTRTTAGSNNTGVAPMSETPEVYYIWKHGQTGSTGQGYSGNFNKEDWPWTIGSTVTTSGNSYTTINMTHWNNGVGYDFGTTNSGIDGGNAYAVVPAEEVSDEVLNTALTAVGEKPATVTLTEWVSYEDYTIADKGATALTEATEGYCVILGWDQQNKKDMYLYDNGTQVKGKAWVKSPEMVWFVKKNGEQYSFRNFKTGKYITIPSQNGGALTMSANEASYNFNFSNGIAAVDNGTHGIDVAYSGDNPTAWSGTGVPTTGSRRLIIYPVEFNAPTDEPNWDGLAEYIEKATSYTIGEGLGQYTAGEGFEETLLEAQMVMAGHENGIDATKEGVQECIDNLKTAIAALSLNMPAQGQLFRIKGYNSHNYVKSTSNGQGKYNMSSEAGDDTVFYIDGTKIVNQSTGKAMGYTASDWRWSEVDGTNASVMTIAESLDFVGAYWIISTGDVYLFDNTTNTDRGRFENSNPKTNGISNHNNYSWQLEAVEAEGEGYTLEIGSTRYSTLYLEENAEIPAGVKVYYCTEGEGKLVAHEMDYNVIPAFAPVIVEGNEGSYKFVYTTAEYEGDAEYEDFHDTLMGTAEERATSEMEFLGDVYVLSVVKGQLGFYKYEGDTLAANRAFYINTTGENVQGFVLNFGEQTTGIESLIQKSENGISFDLQGRRVNANVKGISIVNNKKVIK